MFITNPEQCFNLNLGKTVKDIRLETFQHLILDVALKNHKYKFKERDYLYVYLSDCRTVIFVTTKEYINNRANLIVKEKIGAFYSSSNGGRRAFYTYLLQKARDIKKKSKDVNT